MNGAEVNTQDIGHAIPSPLHRAAHDGHLEIVKELLAHGVLM
ncbi:ankyrin repeat domain-containing protein [Spiroplasma endosymbiont of 'Nebria riversi']